MNRTVQIVVCLLIAAGCSDRKNENLWFNAKMETEEKVAKNSNKPEQVPKRTSEISWGRIGDTAMRGDLQIQAVWTRIRPLYGSMTNRTVKSYGNSMVVKLKVTNSHPTKISRLVDWQSIASYQDEHGNKYLPIDIGAGFSYFHTFYNPTEKDKEFDKGIDCYSMQAACDIRLQPKKSYIIFLYLESPAEVAKELRLTIRTDSDSFGDTLLKLPIEITP